MPRSQFFCLLSRLVSFNILRYMVQCLSIILQSSQPLLLQLFLLLFFPFFFQYSNYVYVTPFEIILAFLDVLVFVVVAVLLCFVFNSYLSLHFSLGNLLTYFQAHWLFFWTYPTDEFIKSIPLLQNFFNVQHLFLRSSTSHYISHLVSCLLIYPLQSLTQES